MKDFSTILMASLFVLFSLIVLLSAASAPDRTSSTLDNDQQRISDLGLRFVFKRQVAPLQREFGLRESTT